jgi:hypothetical protein
MNRIRDKRIFNTPEEVGVRIVFILSECKLGMSIQRIMYYDYFSLHIHDIDNSLKSLHPSNQGHSSEIVVKRELIMQGIKFALNKGLIDIEYTEEGIFYKRNKITERFIKIFESEYINKYKKNTFIIHQRFNKYSDEELDKYIIKNIGEWVGEFEQERFIVGSKIDD